MMSEKETRSGKLTASFIASSDALYDLFCEACAEDDTHLEAEGFCVECRDYLCGQCITAHGKSRASRNHVVQTKDQMPTQKPPATSPAIPSKSTTGSITEKCDEHPDRMIEYFCRDDGILGCSACMTTKHRLCRDVDLISDVAQNIVDSQKYHQVTATLAKLEAQSKDVIKTAKENTAHAEKLRTDSAASLDDIQRKAIDAFDNLRGEVNQQSATIRSADVKKLKDIHDKGQYVLDEVEKNSADLQQLKDRNQLGQLFVRTIQLEDTAKTLQNVLLGAEGNNYVTEYRFESGVRMQEILNDTAFIGRMSIQAPDTTDSAPPNISEVHSTPVPPKIPPRQKLHDCSGVAAAIGSAPLTPIETINVTTKHMHDIVVRAPGDTKPCYIVGSSRLPGSKLILADHDNCKLKNVNLLTHTVTSNLKMSEGPWGVAKVAKDQVAVTLYECKKIVLVKVTSDLKVVRKIPVGGKCTAILSDFNKMVVAFSEPLKIETMTLDGIVERTIDCSKLFQWLSHMTFSSARDAIYVTDDEMHCVKRLTLDGTVEAEYRDAELIKPRGVIVDQYGRVAVCGSASRNIHLLTPNLTKVKVLVNGLSSYPCSLSYSTDMLYVGNENEYVAVYHLGQ